MKIMVQFGYMTNATLELYHALVEAGVTKESAEAAAKTVITRQEAKEFLATKEDLAGVKEDILNLRSEMYKALMIQSGVTISSLGILIALVNFMG